MKKIRILAKNSMLILLCACVMAAFGMPAGEVYAVSAPKKVSKITVSTVNCTTQTVKWKKAKRASGYQIYCGSKKIATKGKAAICINPLNWKTDDTPATLKYDGDEGTVHVDQDKHVLVVEGLDSDKYDGLGYPIPKGIYHVWDIRFYADAIKQNAIDRAEVYMNK